MWPPRWALMLACVAHALLVVSVANNVVESLDLRGTEPGVSLSARALVLFRQEGVITWFL